jgi:hypothetical protein
LDCTVYIAVEAINLVSIAKYKNFKVDRNECALRVETCRSDKKYEGLHKK